MKTIILAFAGFLAGVILFQYLFYRCEGRKKDERINTLTTQLNECLTAPVRSDTVLINQVLKDTIYLSYTYRVTDTVHFNDAIDWIDQTVQERMYTGTYTHPQFDLNWTAHVTGTLDKMTINPPSLIRSMVITKEKTVNISQPPEPLKERSHLYFEGGWTHFPTSDAINADLMFIHKKGIGLRLGISTDFAALGYNGGLIIKLK